MPWTMVIAGELRIPRFVFHGPSCFFLLCIHKLTQLKVYEKVTTEHELFMVPELPHRIEASKMTARRFFDWPGMEDIMQKVEEAEETADGFVLNTFQELEPLYIDEYSRSVGKEVFTVGPVSLFHKDAGGKAVRGSGGIGIDHSSVLQWLGGRDTASVLFVSFGSIVRSQVKQLEEIGKGLEASGVAFVWAMKGDEKKNDEVDKWLEEFEERNREKGFVVKGWVPQVLILNHPAVGGFMTHCGWNSTVEALSAGVPMVTWPHFGDQFMNSKLVVEVLRTGMEVKFSGILPTVESGDVVGREVVERAVRGVMCGGEGGEGMRRRAGELREKASMAMEEGGSSYDNLSRLINHALKLEMELK